MTLKDRLANLLTLPVTRKVALAIALGALVAANKKFALGLETSDLGVIAAVVVAAILGIAYEDAAKSLPPEKKDTPKP